MEKEIIDLYNFYNIDNSKFNQLKDIFKDDNFDFENVDMDDFIVKFPKDIHQFREASIHFPWIRHQLECPINDTYNGTRIWENYERNPEQWKGSVPTNTKPLLNSWHVLETGVHEVKKCVKKRCVCRWTSRKEGIYAAHIRANRDRESYKCES